jgi:hypothetical protein
LGLNLADASDAFVGMNKDDDVVRADEHASRSITGIEEDVGFDACDLQVDHDTLSDVAMKWIAIVMSTSLLARRITRTRSSARTALRVMRVPAAQAGLDLSTPELALKGGKTGAAFKPGSAESSLMVAKIVSGLMPPGKKLAPEQIAAIRKWIDEEKPLRAGITEADVIPIFRCAASPVTASASRKAVSTYVRRRAG